MLLRGIFMISLEAVIPPKVVYQVIPEGNLSLEEMKAMCDAASQDLQKKIDSLKTKEPESGLVGAKKVEGNESSTNN